jgi:hypothetical protein
MKLTQIEQGQTVKYKGSNYVVMLTWGNRAILSPIVGDQRIEVDVGEISGLVRVSPAQQFVLDSQAKLPQQS